MKPSELMIGDWVDVFPDYCRVHSIYKNGKIYTSSGVRCTMDQVEGIEITPEILEANGFKNYKNIGSLRYYKNDEKCLEFEFYGKVLQDYAGNCICEIGFVHELQHALCVIGYKDFAYFFKIK